jgi:hypothetical protein
MTPSEARSWVAAALLAACAPALAGGEPAAAVGEEAPLDAGPAQAQEDPALVEKGEAPGGSPDPPAPAVDSRMRLWTAPEGTRLRPSSPYASGAARARLGSDADRSEAVLRLSRRGTVAEAALRTTTDRGGDTHAELVPTEMYQELDLAGQHVTIGQKVTSWDVAYGFRPLDVVQQERRLALHPFALQGIPQIAWEWLDQRWAVMVLWANPMRGRAVFPQHDESGAARLFGRLGSLDLHLVTRFSERTGVQAGAGAAVVAGDALELHGSARWQARGEHLPLPARGPGGSPLASRPPGPPEIRRDELAAVLGFTLTPGLGLSILGEGWIDPGGDSPAAWRARRRMAEEQRALGETGAAPAEAVAGNLAWGLMAFDRQDLLRQNLLLRLSGTWGRFDPAVTYLFTPQDRGWVTSAAAGWQGERLRLEGGLQIMGGPPGAAYRLCPGWATFYVAGQLSM